MDQIALQEKGEAERGAIPPRPKGQGFPRKRMKLIDNAREMGRICSTSTHPDFRIFRPFISGHRYNYGLNMCIERYGHRGWQRVPWTRLEARGFKREHWRNHEPH